jgi:hypothetical protein
VQQPEEEEGFEGEVQAGDQQGARDASLAVDDVHAAVGDAVRLVVRGLRADGSGELGELLDTSADDEFALVDLVRGSLGKKGHRPFRLDPRRTASAALTRFSSSWHIPAQAGCAFSPTCPPPRLPSRCRHSTVS